MASDDIIDREEVERLVKELDAPRKRPAPAPKPPSAFAALAEAAAPTPPTDNGALTPGQRWTTARLLMPAARTDQANQRNVFAFLSALSLPAWARIHFLAHIQTIQTLSGALAARVFVGLGALLSAAIPYWPYAHAWSWGLVLYLSAVMLVLVTGIWGAKLTWDARLPAAHTVAVGTVLWGFGLLAAEAVPHIAYA